MDFDAYRQAVTDEADLRYLPILYWVSGGLTAFYGLVMVAYFTFVGTVIFVSASSEGASAPPWWLGWLLLCVAMFAFLMVAATATLKILAGFWIRGRRHRAAIMVIAAISCLEIPYGTLLGVLTFIVLGRSSVAALFSRGSALLVTPEVAVHAPEPASDQCSGEQPVT